MAGAGPAWDVYMFYKPGDEWLDRPPRPSDWVHQLGDGRRADPARFRPGEHLVRALYEITRRLLYQASNSAPITTTATYTKRSN